MTEQPSEPRTPAANDPLGAAANEPRPAAGAVSYPDNESVARLLGRLANDLATLFSKELALASAEISESVRDAKRGVVSVLGGGAMLAAGAVVLLMGLAFLIGLVLPLWASSLIVGGVVVLIGYLMVRSGVDKFDPEHFKPTRTQHGLAEDRDLAKRTTS